MAFDALIHGLGGLPLAAREDHPARTARVDFVLETVVDHFQRGGEGLTCLAREHAKLEARFVQQPALLIAVDLQGGRHALKIP